MPRLHHAAAEGFALVTGAYERGRPDYPAEAVAFVKDLLGPGSAAPGAVMDLAAGTGIFTRALVGAGIEPIAIEPIEAMRIVLEATLPGLTVVEATAESLPFADRSFDAVTVAQAFHWFDASRALREIARVLRPGGPLVIAFNVRDERDPVQRELEIIWEPYRGETPTHRFGAWQRSFERQPWFGPLQLRSFSHRQQIDEQGLVDRVVSVSFIASLPGYERDRVAERVRAVAARRVVIDLSYRTDVWWTERQPRSATSA